MTFADDLDVMAALGWAPGHLDRLAELGVRPGELAQFDRLPRVARHVVLRLIDDPLAMGEIDPEGA